MGISIHFAWLKLLHNEHCMPILEYFVRLSSTFISTSLSCDRFLYLVCTSFSSSFVNLSHSSYHSMHKLAHSPVQNGHCQRLFLILSFLSIHLFMKDLRSAVTEYYIAPIDTDVTVVIYLLKL